MARIIEADVIQKIATEAQWLTQTRIPYKGQIMLVSDNTGRVVNMKVGDGANTFANLNYMFDFTNSQRISAVAPGALPTPSEANTYMVVTEVGDYTFGGSTIASITEDGYQATLWWTGSTWVSNGTVRVKGEPLPASDEYNPTGNDAQSQKGVAEIAVTKVEDGNKLLSSGLILPKIITGKYVNASAPSGALGLLMDNALFNIKIFAIQRNTLSTIRLEGNFSRGGIFFLSQFKGDITNPSNFLRGQNINATVNTPISNDYSIDPECEYILLQEYTGATPAPSSLTITKVSLKGRKENQGYDYPFINYPSDPSDTYKLGVIKKAILDAKVEADDSDLNYYQISTIVRASKQGVAINNIVGIMRRKRSDDSLVSNDIFSNTPAVNVLSNTGVNTVVITGANYNITLRVDCDALNEGSVYQLSNPPSDETRFNLFAKWEFDENCYVRTINSSSPDSVNVKRYSFSELGYRSNLTFEDTNYHHFIFYGESLLEGNAPSVAVNTFEIPNDFMAGTTPVHTGQLLSALNLLKSTNGENPFVTAAHQFSAMYRMFVKKDFKSITNSCARGSRSIESLSKECTNSAYMDGSSGQNIYTNRFLGLLTKTKAIVNGLGETVSCPAIVYMQGESNYLGTGQGLTDGTNQTSDKATYKALLMTLKNNMQNDVMSIYGQERKPMFFIYQTGRDWMSRKDQSITQAQIEFSRENDDVVLMNPTYFGAGLGAGTGAVSDHLSENASRWYGEQIAKAMYYTFIKNEESPVITLENTEVIDSNKVLLSYKVPVLPLVFDDKLAIAKENQGYAVYNNGVLMTISNVEIVNSSQVLITLSSNITSGNLEVTYAGNTMKGRGNLRDSDEYRAMFEYTDYSAVKTNVDDYIPVDESDNPIYGKKYPLYNWASHSYVNISI